MLKLIISILFSSSLIFNLGCSSTDKEDSESAEAAYNKAQKLEKDERYEEAITYYTEVKNKFPYSRYATESELKVADIHFRREAYVESEAAYRAFKEFHPTHPLADYVTFQLAMSFFKQLPDTIDRDLSVAEKAILYFDVVANSYPKSDYAEAAKEHKWTAQLKLIQKDLYIADFYFKHDQYDSALTRYEDLLKRDESNPVKPRVLYGASFSAFKIKDLKKARAYYEQLVSSYPGTKETEKAKRDLENDITR